MRLRACPIVVVVLLGGCGAKTFLTVCEGDCPPDAGADSGRDATVDSGPDCGRGPACGAGEFCCAEDRCIPEGSCCANEECPEGLACEEGACGFGDLGCGLEELVPEIRPAHMMLMLDRSESMYETIDGRTKWEIATGSLREVLPRYADLVSFGLTLFPGPISSCQEGAIAHEIEPGNVDRILQTLDGALPGSGGTPIADTLEMLGQFGGLDDPEADNFVLVLSDGSETCRGHPVQIVRALYEQAPRIQVYPVGFGARVDAGLLSEIAQASHTESGTRQAYWEADDATELTATFESVLASVVQCEFLLSREAPDPRRVYAFLDETAVARDEGRTEGYDYDRDTNRVTFFGSACQAVRAGESRITVVFGCPDDRGR